MFEDDLLMLFEKLNVRTGKLNSCVIKAWFDTDCEDLLKWFCSAITEECYVSAQENIEYSNLDNVLTNNELNKKIELIESKHPDLFDTDSNLFDANIANDVIELLENQLNSYNHQLNINLLLNQDLSAEFSKVSSEEMKSQLELEAAEEQCMKLSQELDKINNQTYEQITKYSFYLNNYEFAELPAFINKSDVIEYEEKFTKLVNSLNSLTKVDRDLLEMSNLKSSTENLSILKNRIFNSKMNLFMHQMEIEGVRAMLKFFENYDFNRWSLKDLDSVHLGVEVSRNEQSRMINVIGEVFLKQAEKCVSAPTLRCSEQELDFCLSRVSFLNKFEDTLMKILVDFIVVYNLHLLEKADINSSSHFFKSIRKYINKELQDSTFRNEAMLKLTTEHEVFSSKPLEDQLKLINDFGLLLLNDQKTLMEVLEEANSLRNNEVNLKKINFGSDLNNMNMFKDLLSIMKTIRKFLICGPTCQIVTIPQSLQTVLFKVDETLANLDSSVKLVIQAAQKPKENLSQDEWLRNRNQLWMHYVTDSKKTVHFLQQLKTEKTHHVKEADM